MAESRERTQVWCMRTGDKIVEMIVDLKLVVLDFTADDKTRLAARCELEVIYRQAKKVLKEIE